MLDPIWQASLPTNAYLSGGGTGTMYIGAPAHAFQALGPDSVLRMSNVMANQQRRGWSTSTIFNPPTFRLEIRYNTLVQSAPTSIDAFIELWVIDAANPNRYDLMSPYGGNQSTTKTINVGGSIDTQFTGIFFNYPNSTWFRMVMEGSQSSNLVATFLNDDGSVIFSHQFQHDLSAFPNGFRIGMSQALGTPGGFAPVDVAVDFIQLTAVPEPSVLLLGAATLVGSYFVVRLRRKLNEPVIE